MAFIAGIPVAQASGDARAADQPPGAGEARVVRSSARS